MPSYSPLKGFSPCCLSELHDRRGRQLTCPSPAHCGLCPHVGTARWGSANAPPGHLPRDRNGGTSAPGRASSNCFLGKIREKTACAQASGEVHGFRRRTGLASRPRKYFCSPQFRHSPTVLAVEYLQLLKKICIFVLLLFWFTHSFFQEMNPDENADAFFTWETEVLLWVAPRGRGGCIRTPTCLCPSARFCIPKRYL